MLDIRGTNIYLQIYNVGGSDTNHTHHFVRHTHIKITRKIFKPSGSHLRRSGYFLPAKLRLSSRPRYTSGLLDTDREQQTPDLCFDENNIHPFGRASSESLGVLLNIVVLKSLACRGATQKETKSRFCLVKHTKTPLAIFLRFAGRSARASSTARALRLNSSEDMWPVTFNTHTTRLRFDSDSGFKAGSQSSWQTSWICSPSSSETQSAKGCQLPSDIGKTQRLTAMTHSSGDGGH
ncbi:hypothetical protein K438DRAFT_1789870 [Mycena galopus ATCC 62051]|nr:hypothetical protein K438DRAFT_1789870 [Mycena galopus ATCC 62051]